MLKYTHPTLAWLLHYWPATIFLPTVLLLIAVLAMVTHRWDQRDKAALQRPQGGQTWERRRRGRRTV